LQNPPAVDEAVVALLARPCSHDILCRSGFGELLK
jgi:hypothetical protein